jgi:hypothetical protein
MRVACIMPTTASRARWHGRAIGLFLAQDYADAELLVASDIDLALPPHPRVRVLRLPQMPLGERRNRMILETDAELVAHWDDDDWYAPWRLSEQVRSLGGADVSGARELLFWGAAEGLWLYSYPEGEPGACGATLLYRRSWWARQPMPALDAGEDAVWLRDRAPAVAEPARSICVASIHADNTCRRPLAGPQWRRVA